jgi:hypothetical protein
MKQAKGNGQWQYDIVYNNPSTATQLLAKGTNVTTVQYAIIALSQSADSRQLAAVTLRLCRGAHRDLLLCRGFNKTA